jgi:hypothetical protein
MTSYGPIVTRGLRLRYRRKSRSTMIVVTLGATPSEGGGRIRLLPAGHGRLTGSR